MHSAHTQTLPQVLVINDLLTPVQKSGESLIHWDFFEDQDERDEYRLSEEEQEAREFGMYSDDEVQQWRDDYYASIRL